MDFGEKLRKIRKEKGLTQKELGSLCGIAEPTIRRYESGNLHPKFETRKKIADALGVSVLDLVDYKISGDEKEKQDAFHRAAKEFADTLSPGEKQDFLNVLDKVTKAIVDKKPEETLLDSTYRLLKNDVNKE